MAASIATRAGFEAAALRRLFEHRLGVAWDVAADGKRFLMVQAAEETTAQEIRVVVNWAEELRVRTGGQQ